MQTADLGKWGGGVSPPRGLKTRISPPPHPPGLLKFWRSPPPPHTPQTVFPSDRSGTFSKNFRATREYLPICTYIWYQNATIRRFFATLVRFSPIFLSLCIDFALDIFAFFRSPPPQTTPPRRPKPPPPRPPPRRFGISPPPPSGSDLAQVCPRAMFCQNFISLHKHFEKLFKKQMW